MSTIQRLISSSLVVWVLAAASSMAVAATTPVNTKGGGGGSERCLVGGSNGKCSGGAYNNALSMISIFEKDMGFAVGSFVRVDDNLDKIWMNTANNGGQVQALARYAGDNSRLGYDAGSGYVELTGTLPNNKVRVNNASAFAGDTKPGDFNVVATDSWLNISLAAGVPFAFILRDISMNYRISSNRGSGVASTGYENSDNLNLDYMVTFKVPGARHYFIAWEDRDPRAGHLGDFDYNDFVAEVRFATPVPEPEIYAMLGAGLGLMGFVARRRRHIAA